MQSIELYMQIGVELQEYYNTTPESLDMLGFAQWFIKKSKPSSTTIPSNTDSRIVSLIGILYRFAKIHSKAAMENAVIQNLDEFTYLAYILENKHCTKSEIIFYMLQEKSTGTEILKRLLLAGLIKEQVDYKDKRSKRLALTAKGEKALFAMFPIMHQVSNTVVAYITEEEKQIMHKLLVKLEEGHRGN